MNYLIYGNSYKLIDYELNKIVGDNKKTVYYLDEVDFKTIFEDISYNSFFEEEKYIVVKRAEKLFKSKSDNENDLNLLEEYLKSSNENITLVLVSEEKPSSKSKLIKEILSSLNVIETKTYVKAYELAKDIETLIRKEGYIISQNDLNLFINKCAGNYDIAVQEFEKFKKIKKPGLITNKDVENEISNYNMDDYFSFKDAVINKNIEKAREYLDELESSKCAALPLVVMLANEYKILYDIKYLFQKGLSNDEVSRELNNMHPYRVKVLKQTSSKYSLDEIEDNIEYLCELDYALVSRDNLGLDEIRKFLLEL